MTGTQSITEYVTRVKETARFYYHDFGFHQATITHGVGVVIAAVLFGVVVNAVTAIAAGGTPNAGAAVTSLIKLVVVLGMAVTWVIAWYKIVAWQYSERWSVVSLGVMAAIVIGGVTIPDARLAAAGDAAIPFIVGALLAVGVYARIMQRRV